MPLESSPRPAFKILVADDNHALADVVRFNLQRAGFAVTVVYTGAQAWDRLQRESFDFIVTDYQMPEMNGAELCGHIRRSSRLAGVKVLLLSAKGMEMDVDQVKRELGLEAVMFKPFSPRELVQTISNCLQGQPAQV